MPVHVGLGHSDHIDSISVKWLSGQKDVYTNIAPNQVLKIVEGQSITTPVKPIKDADNLEVMAWPNPFHQNVQFRIRSEKTDTGIFKVFTSSGIEVYQQNIELFPGDTRKVVWTESGSMDQGLYFYIYSSDNQIYSGKLIKQ